jgi:hypothetical protein
MKCKPPNSYRACVTLIRQATLVTGLISCGALAQTSAKEGLITQREFEAVRKPFSTDKCDIQKFFTESKVLGFKPTWRLFDDSPDEPEGQLADLDSDSLCLIAMSSSFQAYRKKPPNKDGLIYSGAIGPKNVFPKHEQVSELIFFLPKSLAPKSCILPGGATLPYTISVKKKDGKLVRRIDALDAQEECFVAVLKKKKLIQTK